VLENAAIRFFLLYGSGCSFLVVLKPKALAADTIIGIRLIIWACMKEEVFLGATWRTDEVFGVLDKMNAIEGANRLYPEQRAPRCGLLPLEICQGAFCFSRERFMKTGDQSLIKDSARFGLLSGLELRHSQIKKRIGVERPFPSAFL